MNVDLRCGDCLELMKELPDASIDCVITDPPYDKASVPLYGELAREARRFLKEGGFLFAYGGMIHPEVLSMMAEHLDFFWVFIMDITKTGSWARWWSKKIWVNYKPIFAFTKGKAAPLGWFDAIHGGDGKDKRYHKWGQSEGFIQSALEYVTKEGDIVLDPFMGGGTTGVACVRLKRNFIGYEILPKSFSIAENRITEIQAQLALPMVIP